MKRKLIIGIGLIALIFSLSGLYSYSKLASIAVNQRLAHDHQRIVTLYLAVGNRMKDMQIELHERWVGHSKDSAVLTENMRKCERLLSKIKTTYSSHKQEAVCNSCHVSPQPQVPFRDLDIHFLRLKEKVNLITANDATSMFELEKKAEKDITEIISAITRLTLSARAMNESLQKSMETANIYSRRLIIISIVLSFVLSSIIMTVTIRSVMGPIQKLASGIEKTSAGDYTSKVDVANDDEIGLLTNTFNTMTDKLNEAAGQKEAYMKSLREINRKLEKNIHEVTEELKATHENMRRIDALALVGTVASNLAHQLATPLATLMGYCRLIEGKVPAELGLANLFNSMNKEIADCRNILTGTLDFVRTPEKDKTPTDINEMMTELLRFACFHATCKNVVVKQNLDPGIPRIMASARGLRQVFMNIMVNALEAMPDGGTLTITTSAAEEGKGVLVSIIDTGHGISRSDLEKIFSSFYTTKKFGTGLGLSISYGIVSNHGGNIAVRSESGKGATFDIFLPVSAVQSPPAAGESLRAGRQDEYPNPDV
ncbi:MAG: HAMP domain-containing protein [Nitrospirae bacterium]|nr:HAMP domain-containing protein [Nitrospirota bacterium]